MLYEVITFPDTVFSGAEVEMVFQPHVLNQLHAGQVAVAGSYPVVRTGRCFFFVVLQPIVAIVGRDANNFGYLPHNGGAVAVKFENSTCLAVVRVALFPFVLTNLV